LDVTKKNSPTTKRNTETEYDDTGYSRTHRGNLRINNHVKPYGPHQQGFVTQSASDQESSLTGIFDPEESHQIEAGYARTGLQKQAQCKHCCLPHHS